MNVILPAIGAGASAGGILLFLSHVMPRFAAANFIRDVDEPRLFGREVSRREAHLVGAFFHLILASVFAGMYGFFVTEGIVSDFSFLPLLAWGFVLTLFTGGIVLPLEGHGVFGLKEDIWFPIDLLITNLLWSVLFWWLMRLWVGWGFWM